MSLGWAELDRSGLGGAGQEVWVGVGLGPGFRETGRRGKRKRTFWAGVSCQAIYQVTPRAKSKTHARGISDLWSAQNNNT